SSRWRGSNDVVEPVGVRRDWPLRGSRDPSVLSGPATSPNSGHAGAGHGRFVAGWAAVLVSLAGGGRSIHHWRPRDVAGRRRAGTGRLGRSCLRAAGQRPYLKPISRRFRSRTWNTPLPWKTRVSRVINVSDSHPRAALSRSQ